MNLVLTAMMQQLWDFLENKTLFDATDEKGSYSPSSHLFEMISLLGPPPNALLERGERTNQYFTARGSGLVSALACSSLIFFQASYRMRNTIWNTRLSKTA